MAVKENTNPNENGELEEEEEIEGADVKGGNDDSDKKDDSKSSSGKSNNEGKKFTQAQVTRMMAKEKAQGRKSAFGELGIKPEDKETIDALKAFLDSRKSDDLKASEAAAESANKIAEAETRAKIAEAKAEAMMMGVKPEFVEDLVTLSMQKILSDDSADLKTIIGEYKTKYPVWFGEEEEDSEKMTRKSRPKGTGSSMTNKSKGNQSDEGKGLGQRLAAQRKSRAGKPSYWGAKK